MATKTDIAENVGVHKFEIGGLGKAPFRFIGYRQNVLKMPDGSTRPGGACDYCGTGIRDEFWIRSADGLEHKVGCDCIEKVDDSGLMKAYKTSPDYRAKQSVIRANRATVIRMEAARFITDRADELQALPHPSGYTNRLTGKPLTGLDHAQWYLDHAGASGIAWLLKWLKKTLA